MVVLSANGKVLLDATTVFITEMHDQLDHDDVIGYRVLAVSPTSTRPVVLKNFEGETSLSDAKAYILDLYHVAQ